MTDFETNPVSTADLVKRLLSMGVQCCDLAADRIEQLEADLTRANAATAAAYEVAADVDVLYVDEDGNRTTRKLCFLERNCIHALATPDQTAALDRLIAEEVKPLINAADAMLDAFCVHEDSAQIAASAGMMNAILAASKKGSV